MQHPLAIIPEARQEDWWQQRHQQKVAQLATVDTPIEWLFLGDSITHEWEVEGEQYWQHYFANGEGLNLGFAGDRTEHVLWRIQNSPIHLSEPKWVILLIGTNNAGHRLDSPEDIAMGVEAILEELKQRLPRSKILLMAIFPRSRNNKKPMRKRINAANQLIEKLVDDQKIFWLDINSHFLIQDDILLESVMPDLLHPNSQQYAIWAKAIVSFCNSN